MEIAAGLGARIVSARYPEKTGDRSARFRAEAADRQPIFIKTLGTRHAITRTFFGHEVRVLQALNAHPSEGFYAPRLLANDTTAHIVWMATEWIDGDRLNLDKETIRPLVTALRAIRDLPAGIIVDHECHKDHTSWGPARYSENINDQIGRLARVGLLSPAHRDKIARIVEQFSMCLDDYDVRSAHGDFAPGNLTLREGKVVVLDWESSHRDRGPMNLVLHQLDS